MHPTFRCHFGVQKSQGDCNEKSTVTCNHHDRGRSGSGADRLQSINGFEMGDPQKALEAYTKLRTADRLTVSVNRHGKPVNIDFNIK